MRRVKTLFSAFFVWLASACSLPQNAPSVYELFGKDCTLLNRHSDNFGTLTLTRHVYKTRNGTVIYEQCRTHNKTRFASPESRLLTALFHTDCVTLIQRKNNSALYAITPPHKPSFTLLAVSNANRRKLELYYPLDASVSKPLSRRWHADVTLPARASFYDESAHLPQADWSLQTLQSNSLVIHDK